MMLGDKLHTKKQQKYMIFGQITPNDVLYSCFKSILTFNAKKTLKKFANLKFFWIQINANVMKILFITVLSSIYCIAGVIFSH